VENIQEKLHENLSVASVIITRNIHTDKVWP